MLNTLFPPWEMHPIFRTHGNLSGYSLPSWYVLREVWNSSEQALALAELDWRDILMAARMAELNWPDKVLKAGLADKDWHDQAMEKIRKGG